MLVELKIKNFALIDEIALEFGKGLNILTGETGAGKSIIAGALDLLLGGKAKEDSIRQGAESAVIEGSFDISKSRKIKAMLKEKNIAIEDDLLILKRELNKTGKSRCYINNDMASLSFLAEIGEKLVDIHGQHEHQSLLKIDSQRELLDKYAKVEILCAEVTGLYDKLNEIKKRKEELMISEKEKNYKLDMLSFQRKEIDSAKLKENEENDLNREKAVLSNAEKLYTEISNAYDRIYGSEQTENSVLNILENAEKSLSSIASIDSMKKNMLEQCKNAKEELRDISAELRSYREKVEFNPNRLNEIEERLDILSKLRKKYGNSVSDILEFRDNLGKEIEKLKSNDENIKYLENEIINLEKELLKKASELSSKRKLFAKSLGEKVSKELNTLGFSKVRFEAEVRKLNEISAFGIDEIEFMISPNLGEELKPLAKIASGGEISRVMLALKVVLADVDEISAMVFDEIDSGIGGKTADIVGKKLKFLGNSHQVLCITHIAQIACYSDSHYFVYKKVENKRTKTMAEILSKEKSINEIARMIGSDKVTDITIKHAKQMFESAKKG